MEVKRLVAVAFRALGLAMPAVTIALLIVGGVEVNLLIILLSIGLFALALASFIEME